MLAQNHLIPNASVNQFNYILYNRKHITKHLELDWNTKEIICFEQGWPGVKSFQSKKYSYVWSTFTYYSKPLRGIFLRYENRNNWNTFNYLDMAVSVQWVHTNWSLNIDLQQNQKHSIYLKWSIRRRHITLLFNISKGLNDMASSLCNPPIYIAIYKT